MCEATRPARRPPTAASGDGVDLRLEGVRAAGQDGGHLGAGQDAAVLAIGGVDQRLVDEVAGLDVGEQQDVGMAGSRAVLGTLVVGSFGIDGDVHGQGAVDDAAGDLALGVHLAQLVGIHGAGHLGVDDLNGGQGSDLGALDAAGMGHGDGVLDDMYFIFQGRDRS